MSSSVGLGVQCAEVWGRDKAGEMNGPSLRDCAFPGQGIWTISVSNGETNDLLKLKITFKKIVFIYLFKKDWEWANLHLYSNINI